MPAQTGDFLGCENITFEMYWLTRDCDGTEMFHGQKKRSPSCVQAFD